MPKTNPLRATQSERNVAERVQFERKRRNNMTYDQLSRALARVGCPVAASSLYKLEKAGRRITVDELVGLAKVFELEDVGDLLRPVSAVIDERIDVLLKSVDQALDMIAKGVDSCIDFHIDLLELSDPGNVAGQMVHGSLTVGDLPKLTLNYPLGNEDDPKTPNPVADAWDALAAAMLHTAQYEVTSKREAEQRQRDSADQKAKQRATAYRQRRATSTQPEGRTKK